MDYLTDDIWAEVWMFLSVKELCTGPDLSCSQFHLLIHHNESLWRRLVNRDFTPDQVKKNNDNNNSSNDDTHKLPFSWYESYQKLFMHFIIFPYEYPIRDLEVEEQHTDCEIVKVLFQSHQSALAYMVIEMLTYGTWKHYEPSIRTCIGYDLKILNLRPLPNSPRELLPLKLQLWTLGGPEKFRTVTPFYFRGASSFMTLVDMGDRDNNLSPSQTGSTLSQAISWLNEARPYDNDRDDQSLRLIIIVIAATSDKWESTRISLSELREYCTRENIEIFEFNQQNVTMKARSLMRTLVKGRIIRPRILPPPNYSKSSNKCIIC